MFGGEPQRNRPVDNQLSGYGYDAAGNMTSDPTAPAKSYIYDAENRITSATMNGVTTSYTYDADGNRVEKSNSSTGTIYWYMSPGIVAESDLSGNLKSEYIFFEGDRIARKDFSGGTASAAYYFSDHLKTASVITNSAGVITEDEDYYPWGGELQFVNSDSNRYKFTGKERDSETQLDYFGARYYGNWYGRFLSADWAEKPEAVPYSDLHDPQSLNLYSYVRNIPTSDSDPDGHDPYIHINEQNGLDKLKEKHPSDCPGLSDCSSSPGPASPRRGDFLDSLVNGINKEAGNTYVGLHNFFCLMDPNCGPEDIEREEKSKNKVENLGMWIAFAASFFIGGEEEAGAKGVQEVHHLLPQAKKLRAIFEALGIDIEKFTIKMEQGQHRLKAAKGIHTNAGGNWNRVWERFLSDPKNRTVPRVLKQLRKMMRDFRIGKDTI